eukprot:scaffold1650_cov135-Cylindrotheca_fusiformis.AAC.7
MDESAYISIRDDSGIRSMSTNERDFLRSCADGNRVLRVDGRQGHELRKIRLHLGRWDNGAECTVQWGRGTRVTSLCSAELVPPPPERPNEGMVNITVDLSPMAGSSFRQAPPTSTGPSSSSLRVGNFADQNQRLLSNRILRSIERTVLVGGSLDTEALVLAPGKWVWRITVALTILDDGGNLIDASIMSAIAVLRHYRKPQVDFSSDNSDEQPSGFMQLPTMVPSIVKDATPLPYSAARGRSSTSFVTALVDPTDREELIQDGNLTIAMNVHSEVCLLDYGGGCEIPPVKLRECWKTAQISVQELCRHLEQTLKEADESAQKERLERLQQRSRNGGVLAPLPPMDTPYLEQTQNSNDLEVKIDVDSDQTEEAQTKAEETYRQQALDYTIGHVASKVTEDKAKNRCSVSRTVASAFASMLKSSQMGVRPDNEAISPIVTSNLKSNRSLRISLPPEIQEEATTPDRISDDRPPKTRNLGDDDDEEAPSILRSEFQQPIALPERTERKTSLVAPLAKSLQEDDMMDLAMAVKQKKKKSKKK